ncbi:MAG: hypothetical protein ACREV1_19395 [Gammaproteobacteria bacterium]
MVFRIGSDAIGTARAIVAHALGRALDASGLPHGAVTLVDTASRARGWALLSDSRLALAVARGSGPAVAQLGAVAREADIPVSLHGTGSAWIVAGCRVIRRHQTVRRRHHQLPRPQGVQHPQHLLHPRRQAPGRTPSLFHLPGDGFEPAEKLEDFEAPDPGRG